METIYAFQINKRMITILDVLEYLRNRVMSMLNDCYRRRMELILSS